MPKINKTTLLTDFKPDEVSLVKNGANYKKAYIIKNQTEEGITMPPLADQLSNYKFKNEEKTEKSITEIVKKSGLSEEQTSLLRTAMAMMEAAVGENPQDFYASMDKGYISLCIYKSEDDRSEQTTPIEKAIETSDDTTEVISEQVNKEVEDKEIEKVEFVNEDTVKSEEIEKGTPAISNEIQEKDEQIKKLCELIEDKAEVNKILKVHVVEDVIPEAIKKQLDAQAEEIRLLKEEKISKTFIAKAAEEMSLIGDVQEVGKLLKTCSTSLSSEDYNTIEKLLKQSHARIKKGDLFKEIGSDSIETMDIADEALVDKMASKIKKENPSLTIEKARIQARQEIQEITKKKLTQL